MLTVSNLNDLQQAAKPHTMTAIFPNSYNQQCNDISQLVQNKTREPSPYLSSGDHESSADDYSISSDDTKSSKSKRRRKVCRNFTCQEFIELMHLSQKDAAKELNVCLSTFKRQFSAIRPKLSWPSPSQRKTLMHRRRFQSIIEKNQEEIFPSQQFEFGKNNDHIFEEILPDPRILSEECAQLKRTISELRKENELLRKKLAENTTQQKHFSQQNSQSSNTTPIPQKGFLVCMEDDCDSTYSHDTNEIDIRPPSPMSASYQLFAF